MIINGSLVKEKVPTLSPEQLKIAKSKFQYTMEQKFVDLRGLNAISIPNRYPAASIDFAYKLKGKTIFGTVDLINEYH